MICVTVEEFFEIGDLVILRELEGLIEYENTSLFSNEFKLAVDIFSNSCLSIS